MSFFSTGTLSVGQTFQTSIDETWTNTTFDFTWANPSDSTASLLIYGSVDEGANWYPILSVAYPQLAGPQYVTAKPLNAVKATLSAASSGNTVSVRFAGA